MDIDIDSDDESHEFNENQILEYPINEQENDEDHYFEPDDEEVPVPTDSTFDLTLPSSHSYLGQNFEELRGRTILDDGIYMNLPLLVGPSVVLFPGQTLPMTVYRTQTIDMLQTCIQNDRTFGVVYLARKKAVEIGTTAEVYEYANGDPVEGFRLKAKGRQRFKILRAIIQGFHDISANVKILPEITLGPPFWEYRLASIDRLRLRPTNDKDLKKQERVENLDATVTHWPAWVYRQYDPYRLSLKIREHLRFIENRGSNIPEDPIGLSYWVAQNLILGNNEKFDLLNYDCAISRLQKEIKYLAGDKIFVCCKCNTFIGRQSNMFPMSKEGPQGTYCNSGGIIHDIITFHHAQGLALRRQQPSTEYTWFPGYAWTIASCKNCNVHMGWKFTAVNDDLRPKAFWGITRKRLKNKDNGIFAQE